MAKVRSLFRCAECGASEPKWTGRCSGCEAWGTLVEESDGPVPGQVSILPPTTAPGVPSGWPPRVAIRSATASTMAATSAYWGSIISWTPMKFGPTTFQWMCLSVSWVSIRATSRFWSASRTLAASVSSSPGAV